MNEREKKAKTYLARYKILSKGVESKAEEYDHADSCAHVMDSIIGGSGRSGKVSGDDMSDAVVSMISHASSIKSMSACLTEAMEDRDEIIQAVFDVNTVWGDILHDMYVDGLSIRQVAEKKRFAVSSVHRLHKRALEKAYELIYDLED